MQLPRRHYSQDRCILHHSLSARQKVLCPTQNRLSTFLTPSSESFEAELCAANAIYSYSQPHPSHSSQEKSEGVLCGEKRLFAEYQLQKTENIAFTFENKNYLAIDKTSEIDQMQFRFMSVQPVKNTVIKRSRNKCLNESKINWHKVK